MLYPSNRGLVQALDAQCGDFVEGRATMLESMVWSTGVRAECLPTNPAQISTALPGVGLVEAMEDDAFGTGIFRQSAFRNWTAETR